MKLLVTGGLGFIGSNFILKMLDEDENLEIMKLMLNFMGQIIEI